ncbi:polysaccharide deacetylase family protein [Rhodoferax sp.]|uniref:polysaccharide deacetylase family protein n=1 Tax=Rhodoferax sp. TaxID=50421 RepID=UPI002716D011|nr:polysaccharide deacetylase family protein [Rhodoferax sp.]MDO9198374.1 polysaccharide deacetylase family protein [Rhodoferax sp.]
MNIPILMYHQIDLPPARGTPLRGLVVSPGSFSRQMSFLKYLGYQGMSMRDLEPYLKGARQGRVVGITFDDGYQNNVRNALPILKKHGFTATCYAVSNMIGGVNSWDRDIGVEQKPLMTTQDWRTWLQAGMDVGSHTRTHADLTQLKSPDAFDQIAESKQELENSLGCEVRHFCYPYGRFDSTHRHMAQQAGYISATTTQRGRVQSGDDPYALRRIFVARAAHLGLFAVKIMTGYDNRRDK